MRFYFVVPTTKYKLVEIGVSDADASATVPWMSTVKSSEKLPPGSAVAVGHMRVASAPRTAALSACAGSAPEWYCNAVGRGRG